MFKISTAFSSFSINNLEKAKHFYGNILGVKVTENPMGLLELGINENFTAIAYLKEDHIPATFTILNFPVKNIDKAVDQLADSGIKFEQYEGEIKTDERGISRSDRGPSVAWFKDPAGNILSVMEEVN